MLSQNILYYGKAEPLPEKVTLYAGPLSVLYEHGGLRSIRLGEHEILRRIYMAVRDRNWGTVAPVISNVTMQIESDRFAITFDAENIQGEIDFTWHAVIRGESDGTILCSMEGGARSDFWKNRIGFCVLHPASLSGQAAVVEHTGGRREHTRFAEDISADQPVNGFSDMRAIEHSPEPGLWAEVRFSGDVFEMEDQRLWTDASYKTFCTPLSLPYPVQIRAGTRVIQSVLLRLRQEHAAQPARIHRQAGIRPEAVRVTAGSWKPLPKVGLSMASHGGPLSPREVQRLRALYLHHLRVELKLPDPQYQRILRQAVEQAEELSLPVEVAVAVDQDLADEQLASFREHLDILRPHVSGWLVFPTLEPYAGGSPSEKIARAARQYLKPYDPRVPLAVGTNTDFIFLKRTRLPLECMDRVCITINPQVHAFDNLSLIETLEAQPMVVDSARRLAGGLPVTVSPITLKPRFNAYTTGSLEKPTACVLPEQVDPRQMSLFGAGWTLGSLRAMVAASACSVTCYETTGWLGVMERDQNPLAHNQFPSTQGGVFPLFHVLASIGEFAGGSASPLVSSAPSQVSGMALKANDRERTILANHTIDEQEVDLEGLEGSYLVYNLDETNAGRAILSPEQLWKESSKPYHTENKIGRFTLKPFGLLWIDKMRA